MAKLKIRVGNWPSGWYDAKEIAEWSTTMVGSCCATRTSVRPSSLTPIEENTFIRASSKGFRVEHETLNVRPSRRGFHFITKMSHLVIDNFFVLNDRDRMHLSEDEPSNNPPHPPQ